eukprot:363366-Chlamydomonas_euryale.AAC.14
MGDKARCCEENLLLLCVAPSLCVVPSLCDVPVEHIASGSALGLPGQVGMKKRFRRHIGVAWGMAGAMVSCERATWTETGGMGRMRMECMDRMGCCVCAWAAWGAWAAWASNAWAAWGAWAAWVARAAWASSAWAACGSWAAWGAPTALGWSAWVDRGQGAWAA